MEPGRTALERMTADQLYELMLDAQAVYDGAPSAEAPSMTPLEAFSLYFRARKELRRRGAPEKDVAAELAFRAAVRKFKALPPLRKAS